MGKRARIIQIITIVVVQTLTLFWLQTVLPGFHMDSLGAAILAAATLVVGMAVYWWAYATFFSWLPVWLFPLLSFLLIGLWVRLIAYILPGVSIDNSSIGTGLWIAVTLTAVNAILGALLSIDLDDRFDRNVTRRLVQKRGQAIKSDKPGMLYLEIDGLSEVLLRKTIAAGHMPNMARWIEKGSHQIISWETEFSSQTGAMQSGILLGNNTDVPAYRWWDREKGKMIMSGAPKDAIAIEQRLSNGRGLCSDGGSSRGNMFSADATESMLTFSTIRDRKRSRGPSFYTYLFNPYVITRLITRFIIEVIKEWWQSFLQWRRKDPYRIKARGIGYAFLRAFLGPVLQDLITFTVISDALRGLPAVYALYAGFDDLAHFAGMYSEECTEVLHEIDRYFGRIERSLAYAPRPYHIVVLSDHGQTLGHTFVNAYNTSLEGLVKDLVKGEGVFYSDVHNEAWDDLSAFLTEASSSEERTAGVVKSMLASRQKEDYIEAGPKAADTDKLEAKAEQAKIVVFGSGCSGLIYFTESKDRMTYEQIQEKYPELLIGLFNHPGVGFIMVRSQEQGDMIVTKGGVRYLKDDHVDGVDPLAAFSPLAGDHMRRESSFTNCPDIIVNARYDPETDEAPCFENQVSHHGGLGGPQNHAFILGPTALPYDGTPVVGAMNVYKLLRGWRDHAQEIPPAQGT
jgi:hypothetical protein